MTVRPNRSPSWKTTGPALIPTRAGGQAAAGCVLDHAESRLDRAGGIPEVEHCPVAEPLDRAAGLLGRLRLDELSELHRELGGALIPLELGDRREAGEVEKRDRRHLRRACRGVAVLLERLLDVHDRGLVRRVLELPLDEPVDRLLQERRRLAPQPADVLGALVHGEVELLEPPGERRPDYPQVRLDERANGQPEQTRDLGHLVRIDRLPALEEREQQPRVVGAHRVVGPRLRSPSSSATRRSRSNGTAASRATSP